MSHTSQRVRFFSTLFFLWASLAGADSLPPQQPGDLLQVSLSNIPSDLLPAGDVEQIKTLSSTRSPGYMGPFNPGGTVAILTKDEGLGFYAVSTHAFTPIESEPGQAIQCPDGYQVRDTRWIAWANDLEVQLIAEKTNSEGGVVYATCRVNHVTLSRSVSEPLPFAEGEIIKSVSPDGRWVLVASSASAMANAIAEREAAQTHNKSDPLDLLIPSPSFGSQAIKVLGTSQGVRFTLISNAGGGRRELMTLPAGTVFYEVTGQMFAWSQTGGHLGFVQTLIPTPNRTQQSIIETFTQSSLGILKPSENPILTQNALEIFDLNAGSHQQLTGVAANQSIILSAAISPEGSRYTVIAASGAQLKGRRYPIYRPWDMYGGFRFYDAQLNLVGSLDSVGYYQSTDLPFMTSENEAILTVTDGLSNGVFRYQLKENELVKITPAEGNYDNVMSNPESRDLYFRFSSYQAPPELYRMSQASQSMEALTDVNQAARMANKVSVHKLSFKINQRLRSAYLIAPESVNVPSRTMPVVMWQNGGPGGEMINRWAARAEHPFNLLPNFGVGVLVLPLDMRPGWGKENWYRLSNANNFGQVDIDSAALFMRKLIAKGYTSKNRIGITGCSYGGYFTSQSITRHPGLYRAANPQCSLLDLVTEFETGYTGFIGMLEGRIPFKALKEYRRDSPIFSAIKVKTPTLIFHGENDFLPVGIAQNFYGLISSSGTPARMVEFMGQGHGVADKDLSLYQSQEQINWFRYYLMDNVR